MERCKTCRDCVPVSGCVPPKRTWILTGGAPAGMVCVVEATTSWPAGSGHSRAVPPQRSVVVSKSLVPRIASASVSDPPLMSICFGSIDVILEKYQGLSIHLDQETCHKSSKDKPTHLGRKGDAQRDGVVGLKRVLGCLDALHPEIVHTATANRKRQLHRLGQPQDATQQRQRPLHGLDFLICYNVCWVRVVCVSCCVHLWPMPALDATDRSSIQGSEAPEFWGCAPASERSIRSINGTIERWARSIGGHGGRLACALQWHIQIVWSLLHRTKARSPGYKRARSISASIDRSIARIRPIPEPMSRLNQLRGGCPTAWGAFVMHARAGTGTLLRGR